MRDDEIVYRVRRADGTHVADHRRRELPDGSKRMWWTRPDGTVGLNGARLEELPLYGSELIVGTDPDDLIVLVEGEKVRDALEAASLPAVGTVCGASVTPNDEVLEVLRGCWGTPP